MSTITVQQSVESDLDVHMHLYDLGAQYQIQMGHETWSPFSRANVAREIEEKKLFKIVVKNNETGREEVGCVFLLTECDPLIWGERDRDPAVYIHRVATSPTCRGNNFIQCIVQYVRDTYKGRGFRYIRMDTKAGNEKLIQYYVQRCGFAIVAEVQLDSETVAKMPKHYDGMLLTLFQMDF